MDPLELTDEQAEKLNRALAGEQVELDDEEAAALNQAMGHAPESKTGVAGSPLEKAMAEQKGDIVTVQTPTGPTQFTRDGKPFYSPDEAAQMGKAGDARFKERALEGALSVLSGGGPMVDELAGANAIGDPRKARPGENALETYVRVRDSARRDVGSATKSASPTLSVADAEIPVLPMIGSAIPSMMAPIPAGALGRILSGGITAAGDQVGRSEADLTKGQVKEFAKDVGSAGGTGLALSAATEALTAPLRGLARGADNEAGLARDAVTDAVQAAKDKAAKSAEGVIGGIASGQGNSLETVADIIRNPHLYDVPTVDAAHRFINSPEGKLMMNRAAMNNLEKLATSAPREAAARLAATEARAAAAPSAVAGVVASKLDPSAVANDVGSKFMRSVGQRAALSAGGAAAGSAISEITGGDWRTGGAIGAGSGWATPGVLQFLRNQSSSPVVQHSLNTLIAQALRGASGAAGGVARAAGPEINVSREAAKQSAMAKALRSLRSSGPRPAP